MSFVITSPPSVEPVTLAEAKLHLRIIDNNDEDVRLTYLIKAAREQAEDHLKRSLITQTIEQEFDWGFPSVIDLERGPVQSVTSITYSDGSGSTQTLDSSKYVVSTGSQKAEIYPAYSETWPTTRAERNAVKVTYVAGYGADSTYVPESIRTAMLLMIGHWFENTELSAPVDLKQIPFGVESLLSSYRVVRF